MAKIVWDDLATRQLEAHLDYALEEFGQKCVRNINIHFLYLEEIIPSISGYIPFFGTRRNI